ncbi:MAG: arsenate reductase (glutaredoxin) [Gammaproteobacteria bacterium]|jgi:arsenate reductase|nr:arsenate reductase (glutaredoxin) [Gammaproteobacteria bacterium]|tara:strand:- start:2294 stop:2662 length:369 start_codon:yes stop_codon:yes gene_type:complete
MKKIIIYHNPQCSKSRQTLEIIRKKGIKPEIILYLDKTFSPNELKDIIVKLGITPRDLLRKGESEYKENNLKNLNLEDDDLIRAMIKHPKLIERPIVIADNKAIIGRPPEKVLELISDFQIT